MVDLRRMRYLINRLPMARFRIERAMAKATKCTASPSGTPGGNGGESQVERGAELLERARETYERMREELDGMRREIGPKIEALPHPLPRMVMRMRYMEGYSAREIAYRLNYSEQHIFRVLNGAERMIVSEDEAAPR